METERTWKWIDQTPFDCTNAYCDWHEAEPNGNENENCLEVWKSDWWTPGTWNDEDGGKLTHYICEKPTAVDTRKAVWIGLNDIQGTQTLVWTDDYPVTFTKW